MKMQDLDFSLEVYKDLLTTIYFRLTRNAFQHDIIKKVEDAGHEIGYHYEVVDRAKGDMEKAGHIFRSEGCISWCKHQLYASIRLHLGPDVGY
jgi:hypothetical protein